jgi:hypothetical protein
MIYFIQENNDGEFIKIGVTSRDVKSRLCAMQTGNPRELELVSVIKGMYDVERTLHKKFAKHRHKGEWFRYHQDIKDFIANPVITPDDEDRVSRKGVTRLKPTLERHYIPVTPIPQFDGFTRELSQAEVSTVLGLRDLDVPTLEIARRFGIGVEEVSQIIRESL